MKLTDTILLLCKALERMHYLKSWSSSWPLWQLIMCLRNWCSAVLQNVRRDHVDQSTFPTPKGSCSVHQCHVNIAIIYSNYQPNLIKIRIRKLELITCRWKGDVNNYLAASRTFKMYTFKTACYYPPLSEWEIEESYREREHRMKDRGYSTCFTAGFPPC